MTKTLEAGIEHKLWFRVPANKTVPALYRESPEFQLMPRVFATGFMVGLIEWACIQALNPYIDWPREQTVGTRINVDHTSPTPPGFEVCAHVKLIKVDGRHLFFESELNDGVNVISKGTHERFIIHSEKFNHKVQQKAAAKLADETLTFPGKLPQGFKLRSSEPSDHQTIISVLKEWWGGRDLTWMLPKLFLMHFFNTSFVIEKNEELAAFLIGFLSPSNLEEGYIHFAGVHPDHRHSGLGRYLYHRFFELSLDHGRDTIKACTSPVNKGSIEFHRKIGFEILPGNAEVDGIPVTLDYNKPNDPKVLFQIKI